LFIDLFNCDALILTLSGYLFGLIFVWFFAIPVLRREMYSVFAGCEAL